MTLAIGFVLCLVVALVVDIRHERRFYNPNF